MLCQSSSSSSSSRCLLALNTLPPAGGSGIIDKDASEATTSSAGWFSATKVGCGPPCCCVTMKQSRTSATMPNPVSSRACTSVCLSLANILCSHASHRAVPVCVPAGASSTRVDSSSVSFGRTPDCCRDCSASGVGSVGDGCRRDPAADVERLVHETDRHSSKSTRGARVYLAAPWRDASTAKSSSSSLSSIGTVTKTCCGQHLNSFGFSTHSLCMHITSTSTRGEQIGAR